MKTEDITTAVLKQLTLSCIDCDITSLVIDTPSFACFPESPTSVTYRARLLGTSETDSSSLISLIEEWVSGGTSLIITGVLMKVDSKCSVGISSLSEGGCHQPPSDPTTDRASTMSSTTTATSDNTAAIIGGSVVAVILIIALTFAAVMITFLKYHGNVNKQKE